MIAYNEMSDGSQTLQDWLVNEIKSVLDRQTAPPPFMIWYDPNKEWLELLRIASSFAGFELWANPAKHELILRDRFYQTARAPRVIWLPCSSDHVSWFKVFELEAEALWEKRLLDSIREYGVHISHEYEQDLAPLLPAYSREWFGEPKDAWKELTPGAAKGTLVDDHRMLEILAGEEGEFDRLKEQKLFGIFTRRVMEDFGLPDPENIPEHNWRVAATARLLATEAAQGCPHNSPSEGGNIIPPGIIRENALRLLKTWQSNVYFIPSFEKQAREADKTLGLSYWARNLDTPPRSLSSRAVEETLFNKLSDQLDRITEIDLLASELEQHLQIFQDRTVGFWGSLATYQIGWNYLVQLAEAASLIVENAEVEQTWKTVEDAITWYSHCGWMLDQAGELLFIESPDLPKQLHRIRTRLRRGYQRKIDSIGRVFSALLAGGEKELFSYPTMGELALDELMQNKTPTALVFLDACSLQFGYRLADMINQGEPAERAVIKTAFAPVPSITALGMAFALPMERKQLNIIFASNEKKFIVNTKNFHGNLAVAEQRRKWLSDNFKVKNFLKITDVLDGDRLKPASRARQLIVVEGREFDREGHEGQLQLAGADDHLERYTKAIRKLRAAGYSRIIAVTDHGFFHWQPETDEIEEEKPEGEVLWLSRRAIVGHDLKHKSAIHIHVPCSKLEAMVPRSVNAFQTYGGLGYFHGGATLQELIIPCLVINWPLKAVKPPIVLKPVVHITSFMPRIEVEAGIYGQLPIADIDSRKLSRRIMVKIREPASGKLVFQHTEAVTIHPAGKAEVIRLRLVEPRPTLSYGAKLMVEVRDADDEELLTHEEIILKVDIDEEW